MSAIFRYKLINRYETVSYHSVVVAVAVVVSTDAVSVDVDVVSVVLDVDSVAVSVLLVVSVDVEVFSSSVSVDVVVVSVEVVSVEVVSVSVVETGRSIINRPTGAGVTVMSFVPLFDVSVTDVARTVNVSAVSSSPTVRVPSELIKVPELLAPETVHVTAFSLSVRV